MSLSDHAPRHLLRAQTFRRQSYLMSTKSHFKKNVRQPGMRETCSPSVVVVLTLRCFWFLRVPVSSVCLAVLWLHRLQSERRLRGLMLKSLIKAISNHGNVRCCHLNSSLICDTPIYESLVY